MSNLSALLAKFKKGPAKAKEVIVEKDDSDVELIKSLTDFHQRQLGLLASGEWVTAEAGAETETGTEAVTETGAEVGAETGAETGTEAETGTVTGAEAGCLCLCFIIIDSLPHEYIWRTWLEQGQGQGQGGSPRVRIYIHAKHPAGVKSPWVRARLVPFSLCPAWGSADLTAAMLRLLDYVSIALILMLCCVAYNEIEYYTFIR
jgi:hypothetical protein